jgi:multiple RNA-binding domain-containing protein 1
MSLDVVEEPSLRAVTGALDVTAATDDDWLRNRTNRLLDLADPNDVVSTKPQPGASGSAIQQDVEPETSDSSDAMEEDTAHMHEGGAESTIESEDANLAAVRKTARIFCRNLPYSATAEDLRIHFEKFGEVEEVRFLFIFKRVSRLIL